MIKNIFIAFENRINNLAMSPETKVSAVKITHVKIKIDILTNGKIIQP
jgi:endothelin-converting enzyme/putative endopeptidase